MPPRGYNIGTPANPFLQVVYFLVGGVLLIGAVLMGAVILAIALGVGIIFGIVIFVRIWWLMRKLQASGQTFGAGTKAASDGDGDVLEVEYTVVDERDERDHRDRL